MIEPQIENIPDRRFIGMMLPMSLAVSRTGELWRMFMPRRKEIVNAISSDMISLQVYQQDHFINFDPKREFEKWALIEVFDTTNIPQGMQPFLLIGGTYAVFHYKGRSTDPSIFQYIYSKWLPSSPFQIDDRPHFEVLGTKYKNDDPDSEEDIWIPVRANNKFGSHQN
jgi:AraC family transcriptional regulator